MCHLSQHMTCVTLVPELPQHLIRERLLPFYRYENGGIEMSQLGKGRKDIRHKILESGRCRLDFGSSDGLVESRGLGGVR